MVAPKLRFKEFSGDWEENTIYNLSKNKKLNNGVFNDTKNAGIGYKLINVLDMYLETSIDEKKLQLLQLTDKEFKNNQVFYGDIFFTRSSLVKEGIAHSNVYLGHSPDITYDGHLIKFSPNLSNYNPIFLNFLLKTSKVRKQLVRGGKTATMTTIGQNEVGNTILEYPSLKEQTKIANFLTQVDQKIEQLTQKHELLIQYKKGMMQKLFSQKIRFKADDGSAFGDWVKLKANKIFENYSNRNHDGTLTILAATQDKGILPRTDIEIDIKSSLRSIQSYKLIHKGNFVISLRSFQGGIEYSKYHGICSPAYTVLKPIKPIVGSFYQNYLKTNDFIQRLNSTVVGIRDGKQISYSAFCTLNLDYPTFPEQTKIANFLSSIDQKIDLTYQQLQQAKQWKKGLLQQMFV